MVTSSAENAHFDGQLPMSGEFRIYLGNERATPLSFDATGIIEGIVLEVTDNIELERAPFDVIVRA
jgi:hypothetical protein